MTFNFKEFFSKKHNTQILTPHEKVAEFFVDLTERNVKKQGGFIVDDGFKVRKKRHPAMVSVDGVPCYKKGMKNYIINEIVSSELYNHLGIYTPKVTPMINSAVKGNALLLSQDVSPLKKQGLKIDKALDVIKFDYMDFTNNKSKWSPLYNEKDKQLLLDIMTEECFNELTTIFILDELRTDIDRHRRNYFLYKEKNKKKYEGIIPIDLEWSIINLFPSQGQDWFSTFLKTEYFTNAYFFHDDAQNYSTRIDNIKNLIQNGKLTPQQIEIIKQALLYDLPQSIVDLENKLFNQNNSCKEMEGIDLNAHTGKFKKYIYTTYESTSKLWEYNNNALEKEL